MTSKLLTKSKYLVGLQCPKYFWTLFHEPDKVPKPTASIQHRFDEGHIIGELAKKRFPLGIDIAEDDFMENIRKTEESFKERKPLFEAGIMVNDLYSRADILNPVGDGWDIIEVKSSTKVKDVNISDVAFQKYCYGQAGLKINRCFLLHINNEYVKEGEIDVEGLFTLVDITEEVEDELQTVPLKIDEMRKVISGKCPSVDIGPQCKDPYPCPLDCWDSLPSGTVLELYRNKRLAFELYSKGVVLLKDIPDDVKLNGKQWIQKNDLIHVDQKAISAFLDKFEYPLYYLDFETFSTAVPLYDGVKPYQQIPCQYSLHIVQKDGSIKHFEFLASGSEDPRVAFASSLQKVLGDSGSVIVYNKSFEINRLKEIAQDFPSYSDWVSGVIPRVIDLIEPFRSFYYYNPEQQGKCGLKAVLPAIVGSDAYAKLDINNGGDASLAFLGLMKKDSKKVRADLLKYCCLDTEAMVWIVRELGAV